MVGSACEGGNNNQNGYAKKMRAWVLIDHVSEYKNLAKATKEVRNYLRDSAVTWWRRGDDDMAEWHEEKGDEVFAFC